MVEKEKLENCITDYEVIFSIKKGKYFCRIPELYLIAQDSDLESCHQKLMKKKEKLIKEIEEFEREDEFDSPSTTWFRDGRGLRDSSSGNDLEGFLKKTGVVSLMILIGLFIATQTISFTWSRFTSTENLKTVINKVVNHPIDPEREKKISAKIRVIVNRLKPIAKELRPLLEEIGLAKKND